MSDDTRLQGLFDRAIIRAAEIGVTTQPDAKLGEIELQFREVLARRSPTSEAVGWKPIETAPRDSRRVLVFIPESQRPVREAWWRIPWDGCPPDRGWWCYDEKGTLLDTSIHDTDRGATHWMPLPALPREPDTTGGGS